MSPCSNCASAAEICVFRDQDKRKTPVSHQYVDSLERRIASLEHALARVRPLLPEGAAQSLDLPETQDHLEVPLLDVHQQTVSGLHERKVTTTFQRTAEGQVLYHGRTSIYRGNKDIGARSAQDGPSILPSNLADTRSQYPQDPTVHAAVRLFFKWQYPNFMFVYREAFLLDYLGHSHSSKSCSLALLYSICALGAQMSADTAVSSLATCFRERAHDALFPIGFLTPDMTTIQALLCLAFAELSEGSVSDAWVYSGKCTISVHSVSQSNPWYRKAWRFDSVRTPVCSKSSMMHPARHHSPTTVWNMRFGDEYTGAVTLPIRKPGAPPSPEILNKRLISTG